MTPAEGLNVGCRVHVRNGNDCAGYSALKVFPACLDLIKAGHIRHRATGAHVWQNNLLVIGAQDIGAFGHEMDTAKNDVFGILPACGPLGELERISPHVGELDYLISLIMMPQDYQSPAEYVASIQDSSVQISV